MTRRLDLERLPESGAVRFRTVVPEDLLYLRGHFDGQPVLPAVVQLIALAAEGTSREWPELAHLRRVTRLKFRRRIGPGATLVLELQRAAGEPRVDFVIRDGAETCSSGSLGYS